MRRRDFLKGFSGLPLLALIKPSVDEIDQEPRGSDLTCCSSSTVKFWNFTQNSSSTANTYSHWFWEDDETTYGRFIN
jgi:hypothetical protein